MKNRSPPVLAETKGSPASPPSPQYAQRVPFPEWGEGGGSSPLSTVQPCNRYQLGQRFESLVRQCIAEDQASGFPFSLF